MLVYWVVLGCAMVGGVIQGVSGDTCSVSVWQALLPSGYYGLSSLEDTAVRTLRYCMDRCADDIGRCVGFSYSRGPTENRCLLLTNITSLTISGFVQVGAPDLRSAARGFRFLVFRGSADTGQSIYDAFISSDVSGAEDMPAAHDLSQPIPRPYKHPLLETHQGHIKQMTLQLWRAGAVVVELRFDAEGADKLQWFSYSRLRASSYSDLRADGTSNISAFVLRANEKRSFWISQFGGGCVDGGWLAVIDGTDYCPWGRYTSFPRVIYSSSTAVPWGSEGTQFADDLVLLADVRF